MKEVIRKLYNVLLEVRDCDVFYGTNKDTEPGMNKRPFIVYQELYRHTLAYADNQALMRSATFQVTLVTDTKDLDLEDSLEEKLTNNGYNYNVLSEFVSQDGSITRIYEIKQEVSL